MVSLKPLPGEKSAQNVALPPGGEGGTRGTDGAEANASGPGNGVLSAYQAESQETLCDVKVRISVLLRTLGWFRPVF